MFRHTPVDEEVAQPFENVLAREPLADIDRQALPSELVHDCQPSAYGSAGHRLSEPMGLVRRKKGDSHQIWVS